jgi:hypothetical protein
MRTASNFNYPRDISAWETAGRNVVAWFAVPPEVLRPLLYPPGGLTVLTNPVFTGFFDRAKVNKGLTRVNILPFLYRVDRFCWWQNIFLGSDRFGWVRVVLTRLNLGCQRAPALCAEREEPKVGLPTHPPILYMEARFDFGPYYFSRSSKQLMCTSL